MPEFRDIPNKQNRELLREKEYAPYGYRIDGTPKGEGFLGLIPTGKAGHVMSEKSMGVTFDGKETLIPLIVPTLTTQEINFLKTYEGSAKDMPKVIADKAIEHALMRMRRGLSPFADYPLPLTD